MFDGRSPSSIVSVRRAPSRMTSSSTRVPGALEATVAEAQTAGVFGVPSFVVGGQVYFGNDRLPILRHMLLKIRPRGEPP